MATAFAEVYYVDEDHHSLEIHSDRTLSSYRLYYSTTPCVCVEEENFITTSQESKLIFTFTRISNQPVYFTLQFIDGSSMVAGYRILPLEGMYNFRDMGGYPTKDGRHVTWGMLYRGDHLHNLKEGGKEYLHALQLHSVIDFRSARECAEYPNHFLAEYTKEYNFAPDGQIAAFAGSLQNNEAMFTHEGQLELAREHVKTDPDFARKSMSQQQIEFVNNPASIEAYANTLHLIANDTSAPLYFHCKGGKDRTGYAGLLLLSILGVEEDIIMYDYLLTNRARAKKNQRYLENFRKMANGDEAVARYLYSVFETRSEYLQAAMQEIKSQFDTVEAYARSILCLSELEIQNLRRLYLR